MNEQHARWLAEELLEIQEGSVEDAKALVDYPLTEDEQAQVIEALDELAHDNQLEAGRQKEEEIWGVYFG